MIEEETRSKKMMKKRDDRSRGNEMGKDEETKL